MKSAQQIYNEAFAEGQLPPRSEAHKRGAMVYLTAVELASGATSVPLGERIRSACTDPPGTAECEAYWSGVAEGCALYHSAREEYLAGETGNALSQGTA